MRASTKAWAVLGLGVVAYDILAPRGETLSEGVDNALERHPVATTAAIGAVAFHLLNTYEKAGLERLDIIHRAVDFGRFCVQTYVDHIQINTNFQDSL